MTSPLELARDESVGRFRAWLHARGLPATPQRMAIATVVLGADRPLSADEVVEALRAQGPAPGTATVYRTIDVLVQSGLAVEEDRREGFRRFQPVRDDVSTEELLCTECGAVTATHVDGVGVGAASAARAIGFTPVRHRLVIYGMCAACSAARQSQSNEAP